MTMCIQRPVGASLAAPERLRRPTSADAPARIFEVKMAEPSVASAHADVQARDASARGLSAWLERRAAFVLPFPAVATVALMLAFPLGYTLYLSFMDWTIA